MTRKVAPGSMRFSVGPQSKRPPAPASTQQEQQIEVAKIDPQELLERGLPKSTLSNAERDLMEHAVPVTASSVPSAPPVAKDQKPEEKPSFLPPPEEISPTDKISNNLIDRLSERFGLTSPDTQDMFLEAADKLVKVTLRRPFYDDYIWTVGVVEEMVNSGEDTTLIRGETQRAQFIEHLSACRCVVKIEDTPVWDVFPYRALIQAARPSWDGDNYAQIPDNFVGGIAQSVHALFRRLHPDLLFDLSKAVKLAWIEQENAEKREEANPDSGNPTDAA